MKFIGQLILWYLIHYMNEKIIDHIHLDMASSSIQQVCHVKRQLKKPQRYFYELELIKFIELYDKRFTEEE